MHEKFKDLDMNGLLFLLEDCLLRIKMNYDNAPYIMTQVDRAKELQEEIKFRTGEVTNLQ